MIRYIDREGKSLTKEALLTRSLNSDNGAVSEGAETLIGFLTHMEQHYVGPSISVVSGIAHRVLFSVDNVPNEFDITAAGMDSGAIHVQIPHCGIDKPIPYIGTVLYTAPGPTQAALVVIHGLAETCTLFELNESMPRYSNDAPAQVTRAIGGMVICPFCKGKFDINNKYAWDGTRHLWCKQKLTLRKSGQGQVWHA